MRRADDRAALTPVQATVADVGLKAMIPTAGDRPFLDYVLSALADAGYTDICLVIGPEHQQVRDYYTRDVTLCRIRVHFAIQEQPLGTADAVLAAEAFAGRDPVLVLNSDNYYPVDALAALSTLEGPGLPGFGRRALLADGHIPPERIATFAVLDVGPDKVLRRVIEKPDAATLAALGPDPVISMNVWLFFPEIFRACREIGLSPRGELEIPVAVQHAIDDLGMRFTVLPVHAGVLDLSSRGDIAAVAERLRGVRVEL
ncbi:MAG: NTP transferase domain-containing protein [Gemmatimonadetes bacterium]|nr:NTP transferase domain-containing protein [Gemmatimonadota bacterium]